MRREGLRRHLALAIHEILMRRRMDIPNVVRYVLPSLDLYRIPRKQIRTNDIVAAIQLVQIAQKQNPLPFKYGQTDEWRKKRKAFYLNPATQFQVSTNSSG